MRDELLIATLKVAYRRAIRSWTKRNRRLFPRDVPPAAEQFVADAVSRMFNPMVPDRDLGWSNGWKETPREVVLCLAFDHVKEEVNQDASYRDGHYVVHCPVCKILYHYDSSD